jgi:hypothetical protein
MSKDRFELFITMPNRIVNATDSELINSSELCLLGKGPIGQYSGLIDTGSGTCLISPETVNKMCMEGVEMDMQATNARLNSANGGYLPIMGQVRFKLDIDNQPVYIVALVVKNLTTPLLIGRQFLIENRAVLDMSQGTFAINPRENVIPEWIMPANRLCEIYQYLRQKGQIPLRHYILPKVVRETLV